VHLAWQLARLLIELVELLASWKRVSAPVAERELTVPFLLHRQMSLQALRIHPRLSPVRKRDRLVLPAVSQLSCEVRFRLNPTRHSTRTLYRLSDRSYLGQHSCSPIQ